MKLTASHHEDLILRLRNPKYALGYLNACLKGGDEGTFFLALRHVAEAQGGFKRLAEKTTLNREHLFRILSNKGNPRWETLQQLIRVFGWRIAIVKDPHPMRKAA
jgi:probable addiction module antidote protein